LAGILPKEHFTLTERREGQTGFARSPMVVSANGLPAELRRVVFPEEIGQVAMRTAAEQIEFAGLLRAGEDSCVLA
jgi:hypothetical protein